jgi:hypothetical protein
MLALAAMSGRRRLDVDCGRGHPPQHAGDYERLLGDRGSRSWGSRRCSVGSVREGRRPLAPALSSLPLLRRRAQRLCFGFALPQPVMLSRLARLRRLPF